MKITRVVHQQIFQLRWQFLACLGLIMVMPLEEAAVNLKNGEGFYVEAMLGVSLMMGPFLAGLIACANVQADLDEKRYIFWMSKPTGIMSFITLKYLVGLVLSLVIMACPVLFYLLGSVIYSPVDRFLGTSSGKVVLLVSTLVSLLTYSLCFLCNVLVRKTARAWLIGLTMTCFLLLIPFMLPLDFRDVVTDMARLASRVYVVIFLTATIVSFVVSLYAVKHNWHLQTNLKGLLWVGACSVFVLAMFFSSQIGNINVKLEQEIPYGYLRGISDIEGRVLIGGDKYINIEEDKFTFEEISFKEPVEMVWPISAIDEGYKVNRRLPYKIFKSGDDLYTFDMLWYYREIGPDGRTKKRYKKLYLGSSKRFKDCWIGLSYIDLSDFLEGARRNGMQRVIIRRIDNKLIVFTGNSWAVVDVSDVENIKLIDKQIGKYRSFRLNYGWREDDTRIPIIPIEGISDEDRIRLSIDMYYYYFNNSYRSRRHSIVDIVDGRISMFIALDDGIQRLDVSNTDDKFIYFRLAASRSFTMLERITSKLYYSNFAFVKNGKLYLSTQTPSLMVFDVRSKDKIRKIGHFVRNRYGFGDWLVLENGDILLCLLHEIITGKKMSKNLQGYVTASEEKAYLYLLEDPGDN